MEGCDAKMAAQPRESTPLEISMSVLEAVTERLVNAVTRVLVSHEHICASSESPDVLASPSNIGQSPLVQAIQAQTTMIDAQVDRLLAFIGRSEAAQ